jgi:hypothetical protein
MLYADCDVYLRFTLLELWSTGRIFVGRIFCCFVALAGIKPRFSYVYFLHHI